MRDLGRVQGCSVLAQRTREHILSRGCGMVGGCGCNGGIRRPQAVRNYNEERGDLYVVWPDGSDCTIEAKISWLKQENPTREITSSLHKASVDAKANQDSETAFACNFFVPSHRLGATWDAREIMRTMIQESGPIDIMAAYFPHSCRHLRSARDGRIYPGIVMVLNAVSFSAAARGA